MRLRVQPCIGEHRWDTISTEDENMDTIEGAQVAEKMLNALGHEFLTDAQAWQELSEFQDCDE